VNEIDRIDAFIEHMKSAHNNGTMSNTDLERLIEATQVNSNGPEMVISMVKKTDKLQRSVNKRASASKTRISKGPFRTSYGANFCNRSFDPKTFLSLRTVLFGSSRRFHKSTFKSRKLDQVPSLHFVTMK
jgi:hypothetical protein